jgi:hypothetical protein
MAEQRGIDRFFAALTALYGAQKVAGMWSGADMPAVKALWSAQLSRLTREAIEAGLQRCVDDGLAWPPTLPEFVSLVQQFRRRGPHMLAIADNRRDPPPGGFQSLRELLRKAKA